MPLPGAISGKGIHVDKMSRLRATSKRTRGCIPAVLLMFLTGCATARPVCSPGLSAMAEAKLFFGGSIPQQAWSSFVDQEITKQFPDGFTVLEAQGQWRGRDGSIIRERGHALVVVFASAVSNDERLNAIRAAYKQRFMQESVLLSESAVCAGF
jgi:hypothetical protein